MSQIDTGFGQSPAMTPPQYAGNIPGQASSWPTVLGVILIVIGSLGVLMNVCGAVISSIMPVLFAQAPQAMNDPAIQAQIDIGQKYLVFNLANALVLLLLGVIMIVAGIGLLKRRHSGVKWSRIWAVTRIIWAIPASYLGYRVTVETFDAMQQAAADSGQSMPPGAGGFMQVFGPAAIGVGFLVVCAIPVFILVWFSLRKIKTETSTWP